MDPIQREFSQQEPTAYASSYCFTLMFGMNADDCRASLFSGGGSWDITPGPGPISVLDADMWAMDHYSGDERGQAAFAVFGETAGWAWAWEDNGWQGVDADAAAERSRGTRLVSTSYSANAVCRFLYAVDGVVVRRFEALFRDRESGGMYGTPLPEDDGLDWSTHESQAAARTLQFRLTGVLMTDFSTPHGDAWGYVAV